MKILGFKLRPELDSWKYYLHLFLISAIVLALLSIKVSGMFTIKNIIVSGILIGISDVIVHTLLKLD